MRPGSAAIVSVVSGDALNRRPQMTAQLIHRAPGRNTWRSKAIQAAAHEDRTRSEGVWMRSAGHAPAGVETGQSYTTRTTCLRAGLRRSRQSAEA